ncbi:MAG: ATP-binding protein [Polyangiales bacterium]
MYDPSTIEVLEGLEPIRRRPEMYVGDRGQAGLNMLIAELVGNAAAEVTEGHATRVEVSLSGDTVAVGDDGRGSPVKVHERYGVSPLEVVFTTLFACGCGCEHEPGHRTGEVSVGLSVVNALSAWLKVETTRDGRLYRLGFEKGQVSHPLEEVGETERRGTRVTFAPDRTIFDAEACLDTPWLEQHLRELPLGEGSIVLRRDENTV